MIPFLADENFNGAILRGMFRRLPNLDFVRVQDAGLSAADDSAILAWAARQNRVLLTHDVTTITRFAIERIEAGEPMPGVIEVGKGVTIAVAIRDLILIAECAEEADLKDRIVHLPL